MEHIKLSTIIFPNGTTVSVSGWLSMPAGTHTLRWKLGSAPDEDVDEDEVPPADSEDA